MAVLGETSKQFKFTMGAGAFTAFEKHPIQSNFILGVGICEGSIEFQYILSKENFKRP